MKVKTELGTNLQIRGGEIIFRGKALPLKAWIDTERLPESRFQREVRQLIEGTAGDTKRVDAEGIPEW